MKFIKRNSSPGTPSKSSNLKNFSVVNLDSKNSKDEGGDLLSSFDSGSVLSGLGLKDSTSEEVNDMPQFSPLKSPARRSFASPKHSSPKPSPFSPRNTSTESPAPNVLSNKSMSSPSQEYKFIEPNENPKNVSSPTKSPSVKLTASSTESLSIECTLSEDSLKDRKNQSSFESVNYDVNPTLLYKFIESGDWEDAILRCEKAPHEASTWVFRYDGKPDSSDTKAALAIKWRMLPIHISIIFKAPLHVVSALLNAYPDGVHQADDRRMLPIHLCSRVMTHLDVAQRLVLESTASLSKTDYKGRTPLDLLKEYRKVPKRDGTNKDILLDMKNRDVMMKMIGAKLGISESELTKHYGYNTDYDHHKLYIERLPKVDKVVPTEADYDTSPTVLVKLLERKMWEQAITRCEDHPNEAAVWMCRLKKGEENDTSDEGVRWKILPIHSAIVLNAPTNVIEALVAAYQDGLRAADDRQMLPLHMAFRIGASLETTAVLVDGYPGALRKKDAKNHTPLHILKAYNRKYQKEAANGQNSTSEVDKNRKALIRFYLGARQYGDDDDATLAPYNSDSEDDDSEEDETVFDHDIDDDEYDRLFYPGVMADFGKLVKAGILSLPDMFRETMSCTNRQ